MKIPGRLRTCPRLLFFGLVLVLFASPCRAGQEWCSGRVLFERAIAHPTLSEAWRERLYEEALALVVSVDRFQPGRLGDRLHYLAVSGSRLAGREAFIENLELEPAEPTAFADGRPTDDLPGISAPPPGRDRFGRARAPYFVYETEGPTWHNALFGVGPRAVSAARSLAGEEAEGEPQPFPLFYDPETAPVFF